jgi:hypothetical protein
MKRKAMTPQEADSLNRLILRENAEWERRQTAPDEYRKEVWRFLMERHTYPNLSAFDTFGYVSGRDLPDAMPAYERAWTSARWGRAHRLALTLGQQGEEIFSWLVLEANRMEMEEDEDREYVGKGVVEALVNFYA